MISGTIKKKPNRFNKIDLDQMVVAFFVKTYKYSGENCFSKGDGPNVSHLALGASSGVFSIVKCTLVFDKLK